MDRSPTIGAIAAALAQAQGQMTAAAKDSLNPHFKRPYADLTSVWNACRTALSDNKLAVVQCPTYRDGQAIVTTLLVHAETGEFFSEVCPLPLPQAAPQVFGSVLTYLRRYCLSAFVGVAPADVPDDDGETATKHDNDEEDEPTQPHPRRVPAPQPAEVGTDDYPWQSKEEIIKAFAAMQPRISPSTYLNVLSAHEITTVKGEIFGTRGRFLAAYKALEAIAVMQEKPQ
jgi:hypothetical protein